MSKRLIFKMLCPKCGSENICQDAVARWNSKRSRWMVSSLYDDDIICDDCNAEFKRAKRVEIPMEVVS